jgi:hypothetical protein
MVSVYPPLEALGARDDPVSVPYGGRHPTGAHRADPLGPVQRREALESVLDKIGDRSPA